MTVIADSAVYAIMSRVNKVVIGIDIHVIINYVLTFDLGTHAVMANGGIISHTGAHMVTICA